MSDKVLKKTDSPVTEAMIFICEKCGKKLSDSDKNISKELQLSLKEEIKSRDAKGKVRAAISSCLDICPEGEIAVGLSYSKNRGGSDDFFTIEKNFSIPDVRDALLKIALKN